MKIKTACCAILILCCFVVREASAQTVITSCKGIVGPPETSDEQTS